MKLKPSIQTMQRLKTRFDQDRYRSALRIAVDGVLAVETTVARLSDVGRAPLPRVPDGAATALVKTFDRPREVQRLVKSLHRTHPGLEIIVVDDSRTRPDVPDATLLSMPFNSGISAGRNAGLAEITTPYFLLLDDDHICYRHTRIADAIATMEAHPEIDILGGQVLNFPDLRVHDYSHAGLFPHERDFLHEPGTLVGGLPVVPKAPNFFLGRTEAVRSLGWSDDLKVLEHRDFFTRAVGVLTTVQDSSFRILHARNPFNRASDERRENGALARAELRRRYFQSST